MAEFRAPHGLVRCVRPTASAILLGGLSMLVSSCGTTTSEPLGPQTVQKPARVSEPPTLTLPQSRAEPDDRESDDRTSAESSARSPHPAESSRDEDSGTDESTVWIGDRPQGQADLSARLHEASTAEQARRERTQPPIAVIDDDNLAEYARDVPVTVGGRTSTSVGPEAVSASAIDDPASAAPTSTEEYWRSEALRLRLAWRDAYDAIPELESEAARLRNEFYAEDDPFYRDREIKPAWDRSLDRIEETKKDMERLRTELEDLMERGRRAGALPGWLREGIELEPVLEEPEDGLQEAEPREPMVLEDPP